MSAVVSTLRSFSPHERIPVNGKPIPRVERLALTLAWSAAVSFIAALIIMTAYFFITQVRYHGGGVHGWTFYLKPSWDRLFDKQLGAARWTESRHMWRNVLDPTLATLFVKSLLANWKKDPDQRVGAFRLIIAPFELLIIITILAAAACGLFFWLAPAIPAHVPLTVLQIATGIVIGLIIHPIYAPVGRTVQGYFVDRQVAKALEDRQMLNHAPKRWMPPVVQELYWYKLDQPGTWTQEKPGVAMRIIMPPFALLSFAMIVFGAIIKFGIAPGHLHWFGV